MINTFSPPENIGFIGLGNMGRPMAGHLARAGYRLFVADTSAEALNRFVMEIDCEQPADLVSLAKSCRVVITILPTGDDVRQVVLGDEGVAAGLGEDTVLVDMTTASPVGTRKLNEELSSRNIPLIDAPVSGGVKRAVDGSLSIMVGGESAMIERCRPILECMGKMFLTGGTGTGHAMKALNNYLSAATLTTSAEAILAGTKFGLDPEKMIEILNYSSGRSNATEQKYPDYVLPRSFNSGFGMGLMAKDLRLARELVHSTETPSSLLDTCVDIWEQAEEQLGYSADHTEVVKYLESLVDKD